MPDRGPGDGEMRDPVIRVRFSTTDDTRGWLRLAGQVEHLFGPMVDDSSFCEALVKAISSRRALCVGGTDREGEGILRGGIVVSLEENEILWFAVEEKSRAQGIGKALMEEALHILDTARPIKVTTFDRSTEAGIPARRLYERFGFRDVFPAGPNPAGIPTVDMVRPEDAVGTSR